MSLQRKSKAVAHSYPSERRHEQARLLDEVEDLIQDARVNGLLLRAVTFEGCFSLSPRHCEHSKYFKHADFEQLATPNLQRRHVLHGDDTGMAAHMSGPASEGLKAAPTSQLGTNQRDLNSEQDIRIRDAATLAPVIPQKADRFAIAAAPSQIHNFATTGVFTNFPVNPWARFASTADAGSGLANAMAGGFHTTQGQPTKAATLWPGIYPEQIIKQCSATGLPNEHVANNQKVCESRSRRHDGQNGLMAAYSSNISDRPRSVQPFNSVEVVKEIITAEQQTSFNVRDNKQYNLFSGLHPSRLAMISNSEQPEQNGMSSYPKVKVHEERSKVQRTQSQAFNHSPRQRSEQQKAEERQNTGKQQEAGRPAGDIEAL